jgi:hypothetical protein
MSEEVVMAIEIIECEQGSPEWFQVRLGLPTASNFAVIMASGRSGGESKTRDKLMKQLAGEILTGEVAEGFSNAAMERGKMMEDEARKLYAFTRQVEPKRVGFVKNGIMGCSPDSLIGDDGALEIKTQAPHLLIDTLTKGTFPPEHKAQCQGTLLVTERKWIDLMVYYRGMPPFIIREKRDDEYIRELQDAIKVFEFDMRKLVKRIQAMQ